MTEPAAPPRPAAVARDSFGSTVALCAALGLVVGVSFPSFHVAIEPAQVLAGIVDYPPENPFGLYERRLWTSDGDRSPRSCATRRALAERYGFRDVLVSPGWELALPLVARSEAYALYRVGPSGSQ